MRQAFAALLLGLAACGAPASAPASGQLAVEEAWAAPTPGGAEVSAGYLTIVNGAAVDDRLLTVSSPRAARVEVHEMTMVGSVMLRRPVDVLAIPAGASVTLAPGGRHLMFYGVAQPFSNGESIPVRLTFDHAGEIDVSLPVRRQADAAHGAH